MLHVDEVVATFNFFVGDDINTVLYSHNTAYRVEAFASILLLVVPPARLLKLLKLVKFARPVVVKLVDILAKLARAHLPPGGADRVLRWLENGHKGLGFGYKILRKPVVHDPYLQRQVDYLWRPGATVGNGGAADALLQEARTGVPVGTRGFYYEKVRGSINGLRDWLRTHPDPSGHRPGLPDRPTHFSRVAVRARNVQGLPILHPIYEMRCGSHSYHVVSRRAWPRSGYNP